MPGFSASMLTYRAKNTPITPSSFPIITHEQRKVNPKQQKTSRQLKLLERSVFENYRILYLPSIALLRVTSSAYSRSPPTGTPLAILVTFTPSGEASFAMYIAVASPSTVGFVARISSRILLPGPSLARSYFIVSLSGVTPRIGEIVP